jgi:tetratricopeptide (TPR) repeat protein
LSHVPIDRPAILRSAEKLLREGKIDQAIAEYLRIVDDQPSDWNTANVLGDLYVRAGQTDRAVDQFMRIADHLHNEGFLPKAAAVYKKILKLKPDHEHATLQAAEIAGRQGLVADARSLFGVISARRRARGDERGVAAIVVRLATLDPNDFDARMTGARTKIVLDDVPGAIADFKSLAAYLQEKDRPAEALQALQEAAALAPDDPELRAQLSPDEPPPLAALTATAQAGDSENPEPSDDDPAIDEDSVAPTETAAVEEEVPAAMAAVATHPPAFNLDHVFEQAAVAPAAIVTARAGHVEVDLSVALDEMKRRPAMPEAAVPMVVPIAARRDVRLGGSADDDYKQALALNEAGRVDEAIPLLQAASTAPRLRFNASSVLARIFRDRGAVRQAIEWFERAAQTAAPTAEEGHVLLFDLAEALEREGETSRALAICMELQADAGNYRDVAARIDRLAKARARG